MPECVIIGGGPAGFSAAVALRSRNKQAAVYTGGQSALAKAARIDNFAGAPATGGQALLDAFRSHAIRSGADVADARIANILPSGGTFLINAGGDIIEASCVILAVGAAKGAVLPGEDELLGRGVSYCATCDGMLFRGKRCVVTGPAADAAAEANFLASLGASVTFVSPRQPSVLDSAVHYLSGAVKSIIGGGYVTGVSLSTGEMIPCEGVFLLRDAIAPEKLVPGLTLSKGYIEVDRQMATNIPGIYAAGDCTGAPLQVAKAVGEGHIAGLSAAAYLDSLG
ncbi:MAG: FAD-dependent oxidoreductase [Oscillospiraceae bacterium]|nr:FAD-dependent oxidoreductase [Oscillospiraceae bacterium]